MNKIEKDIELAKSQILEVIKLAKRKGFATAKRYIIKYGEKADNFGPNDYLGVESIIDSKETNALYTANWIVDGDFLVKILGPYSQLEMEEGGWEYKDYYGIKNVVLVKWDGKWSVNSSTINNGWSPILTMNNNQVYKIYPHKAVRFINWIRSPWGE